MCREPNSNKLSFFKIMINDYTTTLRLPPFFVLKHRKLLPENAKLRTSSGETWNVKLAQTDAGEYRFTGCWKKIVADFGLKMGEFLVFWFDSKSTFDVSVYGTNGCERQISAKNPDGSRHAARLPESKVKQENHESTSGELRGRKSFTSVVKKHHKYTMDIPRAFGMETGITRKKAIELRNRQGRKWPVAIGKEMLKQGNYHNRKFRLAKGWGEFREANNLLIGSICRFEFDDITGSLVVRKIGKKRSDVRV